MEATLEQEVGSGKPPLVLFRHFNSKGSYAAPGKFTNFQVTEVKDKKAKKIKKPGHFNKN